MCMMPVWEFWCRRWTRDLITFGCIVSSAALFRDGGMDLGWISGRGACRMLQSFGLAFLFNPLNVAAFAYVPKEKTNMELESINLARNVGGVWELRR